MTTTTCTPEQIHARSRWRGPRAQALALAFGLGALASVQACSTSPTAMVMALDDAASAAEIDAAGVALCRAGAWAEVVPQVVARPGRARAEAVIAALRCARLERAAALCAPMS